MSPKQIIYSDNSQLAMLRGVDQLADTVKVTFGPRGRNVVLDVGTGTPTITKDGVTVAKGMAPALKAASEAGCRAFCPPEMT